MKTIKSAIIYYYLYKFRKTFFIVFLLIVSDIFMGFFISDLYEVSKEAYLLAIKWSWYLLSFLIVLFLIKNIFKKDIKETKKTKDIKENFTPIEEEILNKKKLKSKADLIIEKYKTKK